MDSTVRPKAIEIPTDSRLLETAGEKLAEVVLIVPAFGVIY